MTTLPFRTLVAVAICSVFAAVVVAAGGSSVNAQEAGSPEFTFLAAGGFHTCAVDADGMPICWGFDLQGQSTPPADVSVSELSSGLYHTCGVVTGESGVTCWGRDDYGEASPPPGVEAIAVASGGTHTCAIQTDGAPICWGNDASGKSSPPPGLTLTEIASGFDHTCAIQVGGTPVCWGSNLYGQATPPDGITVSSITAGSDHTCAIQGDGAPVCWGKNLYNRATPPEGLVVNDISAGSAHTCAVATDGTPICWGYNADGQRTPPAGMTVTEVSSGANHTCAIETSGAVVCWGQNSRGQSTPPASNLLPTAVDDVVTATIGVAVSFDLCANDDLGNTPARLQRVSGWYGPGLTRFTCTVSGTPTRTGEFHYTYKLIDANGDSDEAVVTITVIPDQAGVLTAVDDVVSGSVGTPLRFDICANDTAGPDGVLQPRRVSGWYGPGLFRSRCVILGTPTRVGVYSYTYRLTDADGTTDTADFVITID